MEHLPRSDRLNWFINLLVPARSTQFVFFGTDSAHTTHGAEITQECAAARNEVMRDAAERAECIITNNEPIVIAFLAEVRVGPSRPIMSLLRSFIKWATSCDNPAAHTVYLAMISFCSTHDLIMHNNQRIATQIEYHDAIALSLR